MSQQAVFLFVKALVIGVILNLGIQYFSEPAVPAQNAQSVHEFQQHIENAQADFER